MRRLRWVFALGLALCGVTAWTHHGRGPAAPRIGLSLSNDWYDRSELNPAATGLALARVGATVPRYASQPHKESRAPQNLYPVGGLERELRRRLGDPDLLYRALRRSAHTASTTPS